MGAIAGASTYFQWLGDCLDGIERSLPQIVASAQRAAEHYLQDGWEIAIVGQRDIVGEAGGRSGGLIRLNRLWKRGDGPGPKTVMLSFPRRNHLTEDLRDAAGWAAAGMKVVLFGHAGIEALAREAGVAFESFVDTHSRPEGGLLADGDGTWVVATDPAAGTATLWVWMTEFIAALTRRGRIAPLYQSYALPGARERAEKLAGLKFQDIAVEPMPAGAGAGQFLARLRREAQALQAQQAGAIGKVARQAIDALQRGSKAYVFGHNHLMALAPSDWPPHDAGYLEVLNAGWYKPRADAALRAGDFVLGLSYHCVYAGKDFADFAPRMRRQGVQLAWSFSRYNDSPVDGTPAIAPGETFVDQMWEYGDAVVTIPGYDAKMAPTSGVLALAVYGAVNAEMLHLDARHSNA